MEKQRNTVQHLNKRMLVTRWCWGWPPPFPSRLTVPPALGHNFVDGKCTRCGAVDPDYTEPTNPTQPTESGEPTEKPTQTTKPATDPEGPDQTGESFRPVLLATLLLISAACLGVILVQTRKWKVR